MIDRIIIPTYRRAMSQHTFLALPDYLKAFTTFVVDEQDADVLASLGYEQRYGSQVVIHDPNINSIAQKRAWIMRERVWERIIMMDDDLRFASRQTGKGTKLFPSTKEEIGEAMERIFDDLQTYAHVGISPRQGNNNVQEGEAFNTRMVYVLGYDLEIVRRVCKLGRIETREDMDYTLQLLRNGFRNKVLFNICVDQKYNAPGGCSEERTMERSNADAVRLAELHPGLVKVVEKKYKSSVPRQEVICYWKKALKSANAGS